MPVKHGSQTAYGRGPRRPRGTRDGMQMFMLERIQSRARIRLLTGKVGDVSVSNALH